MFNKIKILKAIKMYIFTIQLINFNQLVIIIYFKFLYFIYIVIKMLTTIFFIIYLINQIIFM